MESIGEKLRTTREHRDISLEQAARDTHIARHYLASLESEEFDDFPGETYLIGFLRSYAQYLELNDGELVALYRNIQIQEQPVPMDELLHTGPDKKTVRIAFGLIVLVTLVVAAVLVAVFGDVGFSSREPDSGFMPEAGGGMAVSRLDQEFLERRFCQGERIIVPVEDQEMILEFVVIDDAVTLGAGEDLAHIGRGENRALDLNGDGISDVRVFIREIEPGDTPPSVVARLDRVVQSPNVDFRVDPDDSVDLTFTPGEYSRRIIAQFDQPEEYFIEADFRGYTMFRYEIDAKERRERFFQRGNRVRDSVQDGFRVWTSNAGNIRLRVAGIPVELGGDGEVVAVEFLWVVDEEGLYNLELRSLD